MYASDTLNAFVCPVSLTSIPDYPELPNVTESANTLTVDERQTALKIGLYVPDSVIQESKTMTNDQKKSRKISESPVGWFDFSVRKRIFQDNILSLTVYPVHPAVLKERIQKDDAYSLDENVMNTSLDTTKNAQNYMVSVYNDGAYYCALRNDVYSFDLNGTIYEAAKYSQFRNETPVFAAQNIALPIRHDGLVKSMDLWNTLYEDGGYYHAGLSQGVYSAYGNGYQYLPDSLDEG